VKDYFMKEFSELTALVVAEYGDLPAYPKADIRSVAKSNGLSTAGLWKGERRVGRGLYRMDNVATVTPITAAVKQVSTANLSVETNAFTENLIPEKDELFVPFGNFKVVRDIIKSRMFYPIFITGLSGNGKTYMVEQACAATKREVIRVNFTVETDEDDLIGGFRLVDGDTKFFKGPVISAMEKGAVLLCDEIDLANPAKVMCLQSILEGNGYFIKKTGEYITPAPGFTVVATANTKGKGSDDGRFIGTNILNEAFLERYPITCEQEYPSISIERKILTRVMEQIGIDDQDFVEKLTDWADIIRKTFADGGVDEIISTRRLVHIVRAHAIFDDRMTSIEMCTNRFDEETKLAFRDLYTKLDAGVISAEEELEIPHKDMTDEEFVDAHKGL
jgi:MoxR-like ATPase